ncbi:MAG: peptidoglycan DD-metalloendopeptidase family protein [bacterium]|nr:peptidoglycan DD-metalloendopeptidase family protein [bacterium]
MFKTILIGLAFLLSTFYFLFSISNAFAATLEELRQAIDEQNKSLQEVNLKIQQAQKDLEATVDKGKTLNQEIKRFDSSIGQLSLLIKSSVINIDRTKLEIEALQYDVNETELQINLKRGAIAGLLRELQQKDKDAVLITLLKYKSLAASVSEVQNIFNVNVGLSEELGELQILNGDLNNKLDTAAAKKQKLELENRNLANRKVLTESQKKDRQSLLTQTKNQEKTYQSLISELEKQQDAISDQIAKIEDTLRASFDPSLLPSKRPGVFAWPVKLKKDGGTAYITQHFGEQSYLYRGKPHNGLDIGGAPIGTPVFAAEDGKVRAVDNNDVSSWKKYQYGKYVLIEHNNNLSTLYAHLSKQIVAVGSMVKRGDLIGYVGNTGYATGPHLHFGVYWTPSILLKSISPAAGLVPVGVVISPEDYL